MEQSFQLEEWDGGAGQRRFASQAYTWGQRDTVPKETCESECEWKLLIGGSRVCASRVITKQAQGWEGSPDSHLKKGFSPGTCGSHL